MTILNARLAGPFSLDQHGFCLGRHHSDITDWERNYGPASTYAVQVGEVAARLSGADLVLPLGGTVPNSAPTGVTVQSPAAEPHVDFTQRPAERVAEAVYRADRADGPGYRRLIAFSPWRALSPPPQDVPLALCEGRSVRTMKEPPIPRWMPTRPR